MESTSLERSTIVADNTSSSEFGTIIGADANFKGDLSFDSAAKILGKFEGSISAKGKIHVSDGSRCKAKVSAKEVAVEGHIEGNVEAADRVDLRPKGRITGDITAANNGAGIAQPFVMSRGGTADGGCCPGGRPHPAFQQGQPGLQALGLRLHRPRAVQGPFELALHLGEVGVDGAS
jgi:cytoskeletal protein CcmA (bactofilin family)